MGWRWRKKTVRGFGRTTAAVVGLLAIVTLAEWWDGDPVPVIVAWSAATVVAGGLVAWAFRVEAERAFGPPGSPERRRRRLTRGQLARCFGAGVLAAGAATLFVLLVTSIDDSRPPAGGLVVFAVVLSLAYGAAFAWSEWAAVDDEAVADADGIPARSVPRPVAAPPRDRRLDRRRALTVCALLTALGVLAAVDAVMAGDGGRAGIGIGFAAAAGALLVWGATQAD